MGFFSRLFGGVEARCRELAARVTESEASQELIVIGEPAVPALRALRQHPDGRTRREAVSTLSQIGSPAALDGIAEAAEDPETKWLALSGLAHAGDRRALEPLTALLRSTNDRDLRLLIIQGLGRVGDESTIPRLEALPDRSADSLSGLSGEINDAIDRIRMRTAQRPRAVLVALDLAARSGDVDFAAVFLSTRQDLLVRWAMPRDAYPPPLHTMACDVCSAVMMQDDHQRSLRVPASHYKECVRYGYNPVLTVLSPREQLRRLRNQRPPGASLGETLDKMQALAEAAQAGFEALKRDGLAGYYAGWQTMVQAATTDWSLCPRCARDLKQWLWPS
jgi:hypothetical protein